MGAGAVEPHAVSNLVGGQWTTTRSTIEIIHPMDRDAKPIFTVPDTQEDEIGPFVESLRSCPKSGLHNPLKNPERYLQFGDISRKVQFSTCMCLSMYFSWPAHIKSHSYFLLVRV